MNQKFFTGYGSIKNLYEILKIESPNQIFLVTGKNSFITSGAEELIRPILNNYNYITYNDFDNNPKIEDVEKGITEFNNNSCDSIIGIGGGSVMDMAKSISFLSTQNNNINEIIEGKASCTDKKFRTIMIPTTAGTGSESTHFSVIYINNTKHSLSHDTILPNYVILDPYLTDGLSPYITACTGMDALCQGIESFWSVNSTKESREYSKMAIELSISNLAKTVKNPDKTSRENMLQSSNYSGRAINIAKTTIAHSVSYPITSYFNIPHGHAVALTLPCFIEFNSNISSEKLQDDRGAAFVADIMSSLFRILNVSSGEMAKNKFITLMKEISLKHKLSELGIMKTDLEVIIKNGFNPQRAKNNPAKVTENDLYKILTEIL